VVQEHDEKFIASITHAGAGCKKAIEFRVDHAEYGACKKRFKNGKKKNKTPLF